MPEESVLPKQVTSFADTAAVPRSLPQLTDEEREVYSWQLGVRDFGEEGQRKLKDATVLISRVGGLGSAVAYELAAAGIGRLILAHGGNIQPADLNRQLLMTHDGIGKPRILSAARRLKELNPRLDIVAIEETKKIKKMCQNKINPQHDVWFPVLCTLYMPVRKCNSSATSMTISI